MVHPIEAYFCTSEKKQSGRGQRFRTLLCGLIDGTPRLTEAVPSLLSGADVLSTPLWALCGIPSGLREASFRDALCLPRYRYRYVLSIRKNPKNFGYGFFTASLFVKKTIRTYNKKIRDYLCHEKITSPLRGNNVATIILIHGPTPIPANTISC